MNGILTCGAEVINIAERVDDIVSGYDRRTSVIVHTEANIIGKVYSEELKYSYRVMGSYLKARGCESFIF